MENRFFCNITGLWKGRTSLRRAHRAADLFVLLRGIFLRKNAGLLFKCPELWLFPLIAGIGFFVLNENTASEWRALWGGLSFFLVILFGVAYLLASGFRRSENFFFGLFHLDSFIGLLIAAYFWKSLSPFLDAKDIVLILSESRSNLVFGLIFVSAYLWLRVFESYFTDRKKVIRFNTLTSKSLIAEFNSFSRSDAFWRFAQAGFVLLVLFACSKLMTIEIGSLHFLLALVPLVFPTFNFSRSLRHHALLTKGISVPSFRALELIRKIKHLSCHGLGVFFESQVEVAEEWFDSSSIHSEKDLKQLIQALAETSNHPVSRALAQYFLDSKAFELSMTEVEETPHTGLKYQKRNAEGKLVNYEIRSSTWAQLARHEGSSEFHRKIESWNQESVYISCFSIDHRIVAAFKIQAKKQADVFQFKQVLERYQMSASLLSSGPLGLFAQDEMGFLKELKTNQVPIERERLHRRWLEREPAAAEVLTDWDRTQPGYQAWIIFCRENQEVVDIDTDKSFLLRQPSFDSLDCLFQSAKSLAKVKQKLTIAPIIFAIGIGLLPDPVFAAAVSLLSLPTLFCLATSDIK